MNNDYKLAQVIINLSYDNMINGIPQIPKEYVKLYHSLPFNIRAKAHLKVLENEPKWLQYPKEVRNE